MRTGTAGIDSTVPTDDLPGSERVVVVHTERARGSSDSDRRGDTAQLPNGSSEQRRTETGTRTFPFRNGCSLDTAARHSFRDRINGYDTSSFVFMCVFSGRGGWRPGRRSTLFPARAKLSALAARGTHRSYQSFIPPGTSKISSREDAVGTCVLGLAPSPSSCSPARLAVVPDAASGGGTRGVEGYATPRACAGSSGSLPHAATLLVGFSSATPFQAKAA